MMGASTAFRTAMRIAAGSASQKDPRWNPGTMPAAR